MVDPRAQIERRHSILVRCCKPEPKQRIDDRERLDRLLGIEIVPFVLVGKVKTWSDDRDAPDAAGTEQSLGLDGLERLLTSEISKDGRVR